MDITIHIKYHNTYMYITKYITYITNTVTKSYKLNYYNTNTKR